MKYLTLLTLLFSLNAFPCEINYEAMDMSFASSLNDDAVKAIKETTCDNFAKYKGKKEGDWDKYIENIRSIARNQTNQIWKMKNRHDIGNALAQCTPDKDTKALVITFAGTGSYNPRAHSLMAELIQCKKFQYMKYGHKKNAHYPIMKYLKDSGSMFKGKYDMIASGPLAFFLKNHELNKQARYFKFASFASEEVELLGDQSKMSETIARVITGSGLPAGSIGQPGIENALACVKKFFGKADNMGISPRPKLIVMGHSSGGRAAVKFLERLEKKDYAVEADLVATIDPVKEAHTVALEKAAHVLNTNSNPLTLAKTLAKYKLGDDNPLDLGPVQSLKQPEILYKTSNTKRWINFYQKEDKQGIGAGFGIYGSPIMKADLNTKIEGAGKKGHGEICKKYKVNNKIKEEILKLFE